MEKGSHTVLEEKFENTIQPVEKRRNAGKKHKGKGWGLFLILGNVGWRA